MPITKLTANDLRFFENLVADAFNAGNIKAPVHLSGGNEEDLIEIFRGIKHADWVCSTWRSHYHCLLKGVPPDKLMKDICDGHSITLTYPEQRVITSAIVGGIIPIALGLAYGIKEQNKSGKVWCFIGDMTASAGAFLESLRYAIGFDLPITFVVEDNAKSVGTPTHLVWSSAQTIPTSSKYVIYYQYELPWPHAGSGKWVEF